MSTHRLRALTVLMASIGLLAVAGCGSQNQANNTAQNTTTANSVSQNTTAASQPANTTDASAASGPQQWASPPAMQLSPNKQYDAIFHTNYGDFTVHLLAKNSPNTVNNFVFLAQHHFYNGDKFFRIIKTFMIQTGDPSNSGMGGPGYQFADELPPKIPYGPGIVAMANAGPNTNGSQFFICTGPDSEKLPPDYTEFGQVTSGMNVVEAIASIPVVSNPQSGEPSMPTKDAVIQSITIQIH